MTTRLDPVTAEIAALGAQAPPAVAALARALLDGTIRQTQISAPQAPPLAELTARRTDLTDPQRGASRNSQHPSARNGGTKQSPSLHGGFDAHPGDLPSYPGRTFLSARIE